MFDFMVWRHSCLSLSRTTGKFKLVENGKVAADEYSSDIINFMKKIPVEVYNSVSSFIAYKLLSSFFSVSDSLPFSGQYLDPWLLLQGCGGEVHVHVRVSDRRPGVQQGAEQPGHGGYHLLQVRSELTMSCDILHR